MLDISGGTLPPNVFIREDPDRHSTGQTAIMETNSFMIASFFDVFTELSVAGPGGPFVDSIGSTRMELQIVPEPATLAMLGAGLAALAAARRLRRGA